MKRKIVGMAFAALASIALAGNAVAIEWNASQKALYAVIHGRDSLDTLFPALYKAEDNATRTAGWRLWTSRANRVVVMGSPGEFIMLVAPHGVRRAPVLHTVRPAGPPHGGAWYPDRAVRTTAVLAGLL